MSNLRGYLLNAHKQFLADLKDDKDFNEFKKRAMTNPGDYSYGTIVAGDNRFVLNSLEDNTIIAQVVTTTHYQTIKSEYHE